MLIGTGKARDVTLLHAIDNSDCTDTRAMEEKHAVRLLTKMYGRMQADCFSRMFAFYIHNISVTFQVLEKNK